VAATAPPRRTWDVVLTTGLLLYAVFDVVTGFAQFADLPATLRQVYEQQGFGRFTADELASTAGIAANIVRVSLLVIAIPISLALLARGRRAFWVPLAAGVLAALVVSGLMFAVVLTDPALAQYVTQQSGQ
jgi:hypothetical protein